MAQMWQQSGIAPGAFYLPRADVDLSAWAVVACDQYTAQPDMWEKADALAGGKPSALRLIIPEAYLNESETRVPQVNATMGAYLREGIVKEAVHGMVLVARTTQSGTRLGLLLTVDLEHYDYAVGSRSLIRATEGTILSRIPPRLAVRKDAPLELSHVLLLADDPKRTLIEPLYAARERLRPVYDTALMLGGGSIRAFAVENEEDLANVSAAVQALQAALPEGGILFAVGDGNHSLATAKAHWENIKKAIPLDEQPAHPARYAMAELMNIYDDALIFEPIHRVIFEATQADVMDWLAKAQPVEDAGNPDITLVTAAGDYPLRFRQPLHSLPVGTLQKLLDAQEQLDLDYVHGEDAVRSLVLTKSAIGILLPAMDKAALFPAVETSGALPRKTFSMGEANEKRYYMEARKIIK